MFETDQPAPWSTVVLEAPDGGTVKYFRVMTLRPIRPGDVWEYRPVPPAG